MDNPILNSAGGDGAMLYIPTSQDYEEFEKWKSRLVCSDTNAQLICSDTNAQSTCTIPKYSMLNNYLRLASWEAIGNFKDCVGNIFYLVFKPKNKNYNSQKCFMDHVRKKVGKFDVLIITREINSSKVHYNVLVRTSEDLTGLHDTQDSRFYIWCKSVKKDDIYKVHEYIIKESKVRYFYDNKDIYTQIKYQGKFVRKYNNLTSPHREK